MERIRKKTIAVRSIKSIIAYQLQNEIKLIKLIRMSESNGDTNLRSATGGKELLPPKSVIDPNFDHKRLTHLSPRKDALVNKLRATTPLAEGSTLPKVMFEDMVFILTEERQDIQDQEANFLKTDADPKLLHLLQARKQFAEHPETTEFETDGTTYHRDTIDDEESQMNPFFSQRTNINRLLDYAINVAVADKPLSEQARMTQQDSLLSYLYLNEKRWLQDWARTTLQADDENALEHVNQNARFFQGLQSLVRNLHQSDVEAYKNIGLRMLSNEANLETDATVITGTDEQSPFFAHQELRAGGKSPLRDAFLSQLAEEKQKGARSKIGFEDIVVMFDKERKDFGEQYAALVKEFPEADAYFKNNKDAKTVAVYTLSDGSCTTNPSKPDQTIDITQIYNQPDMPAFAYMIQALESTDGVPVHIQDAQDAASQLVNNTPITEIPARQLASLTTVLTHYMNNVVPENLKPYFAMLTRRIFETYQQAVEA